MKNTNSLALLLLAIGLGSLVSVLGYSAYAATSYVQSTNWNRRYSNQWTMGGWQRWSQQLQTSPTTPIMLDQAKQIAQQYLASTGNSNLAIKEIMEFQYNFYINYYEKDTGIGAFEMLIWKQSPPNGMYGGGGGMGGGMMGSYGTIGTVVPEPGPNMMWNTKYSPMGQGGMMGNWNQPNTSGTTITKDQATQNAQTYLNSNFKNAEVEMATQFYGYYTFDFTVNGNIAGMLSVNAYTGQVWYHSWHGNFIQEVEFD